MCRFVLPSLLVAIQLPTLHAQEWTRFRGPNGSGVCDKILLRSDWSDKDYQWKVKLPGKGHSSPVVWGDKIFVTSADAEQRSTHCIDASTGKELWQHKLPGDVYKMHKRNSVATSSPVVDAERVYVLWASPSHFLALALDHKGNVLWQNDLGPYKSQHGLGVSPIVVEDVLVICNDQDGTSTLVGLDVKSGNARWTLPRKTSNATYATPCVYQQEGKPAVVIFSNWKHGITAVDPKAGKVAWEISCFEPEKQERAIVSPLVAGDLVLGTCGFVTAQKHLVAVRPTSGDKAEEVWRFEKNVAHLSTPIVVGDHIYSCTELGFITCLDRKTGELLWQERVDANFSASPVAAGGLIYCVADDGNVFVVKAGPKFEAVSRPSLGEKSQATPALTRQRVIFRTERHLLALPTQ